MRFISGVRETWMGLCRKPPVVQALPAGFGIRPDPVCTGQPGGGGSGSLQRGIGSAVSGMRVLNRNRQLLWFSVLAGLVLAGNIVCQGALCYIDWVVANTPAALALSFLIEMITLFCLVVLLAGVILSISSEKTGAGSIAGALADTRKHLRAILVWSVILALAGTLLYRYCFSLGGIFWPIESHLLSLLTQYPFTLNLNPSTFAEIPGYGGRSVLFWTYPYGFENALIFSAINLLLFLLTAFVVPLIVLDQKTVREAVAGSVALMKKTWAEAASCAIFLGGIVTAVFLTFLLVQAAHGMFTPIELLYDRPYGPLLILAFAYYLSVFSVALVMATVGGIAIRDIYRSAKICSAHENPGSGGIP